MKPDYGRCVAIVASASLREMIKPGALAIISPIVVGGLIILFFQFYPSLLYHQCYQWRHYVLDCHCHLVLHLTIIVTVNRDRKASLIQNITRYI